MNTNLDIDREIIDDINEDIDNIIINPLYNNKKQKINDGNNYDMPSLNDLSKNELYNLYGCIYIICRRNNIDKLEKSIYEKTILQSDFDKEVNKLNIIDININIINDNMKMMLGIISKNNLMKICSKYQDKYRENNLYIFIPFIEEKNIENHLKQYNGVINFEQIYNMYLLDQFFCNKNYNNIYNKITILNSMNESNYWCNKKNTQLNITLKFIERSFNLSLSHRLNDSTVIDVLKKISSCDIEDNNYLSYIFRKTLYTDASSGIKKSGYKIYKINNNNFSNKINNDIINKIYNLSSNIEKYYLILNLLISKNYCHLIINNKILLNDIINNKKYDNNMSFFDKNYHIFRYLMSYSWLTLYLEESIKKTYIDDNDRFVFDIDTASLLPHFPFIENNIHNCPYLPILVEKSVLNVENNVLGVKNLYITIADQSKQHLFNYGVSNFNTFYNRLKLFINGNTNNYDLLKDVNWNNLAITGSIMACCLPNFNPLFLNFIKNDYIIDSEFLDFINYYYSNADIDIMCNLLDFFQFVDKIYEFKDIIVNNINNIDKSVLKNDDIENYTLNHLKTIVIMVNKNYIDKLLLNNKDINMDFKDIIINLNDFNIKKIIYEDYINWQVDENKKYFNTQFFNNSKYLPIFEISNINNVNIIFIKSKNDIINDNIKWSNDIINKINNNNDDDNDDDNINEEDEKKEYDKFINDNENDIIIKVNLKYKLSSKYLAHPFEIFQTKYENFFATVARFHLPPVRAYYNGKTVYMLPSCITSCHTLLNIDYKYFAGTKDPIEIINKYRFRGFGTLLNDKEKVRLIEYSSMITKWNILYNDLNKNIKNKSAIDNIFGSLKYTYKLFTNNITLTNKIYNISMPDNNSMFINNLLIFNKNNNIDNLINQLTMINKKGYVVPLQKWVIEANYNKNYFN